MSLINKASFLWDGHQTVVRLIEKWNPGKLKSEKEFEKSLYEYLHEELDGVQITKQYARGRVHADIVIADNIIIELKNNLNTTSQYHRLVGQIEDYRNWDDEAAVIIILCGKTDKNLLNDLKKHVSGGWLGEEKAVVVQK